MSGLEAPSTGSAGEKARPLDAGSPPDAEEPPSELRQKPSSSAVPHELFRRTFSENTLPALPPPQDWEQRPPVRDMKLMCRPGCV